MMSYLNRLLSVCFLLFFTLVTSIKTAHAVPQFFTDETSFQTATLGATFHVEGFESLPVTAPTSTIVANDFTITNPGGSNDINVQAFAPVVTEGTQTAVWRNSFGQFVIDFSNPINAIGMDITDLGTFGAPTDFSVSVDGGSFQTLFSIASNEPAFNVRFAGIVDTTGSFSQLIFTNDAAGDAINFDRVQYAFDDETEVAEPHALALIGLTFAGLISFRRRMLNQKRH